MNGPLNAHGSKGYVTNRCKVPLLPPAYVVRREGNSFTLLVCPQGWGVSPARGGSGQSSWGGGVRSSQQEGVRSSWGGGVRSSWGGESGPAGRGGSAKIGQQNEYSLHCGRYASCVHAGGLSCCEIFQSIFYWNYFMNITVTRKFSCVNARGIPTAAYQVLHLLSCTGGGTPCHTWGTPIWTWWGVPPPGIHPCLDLVGGGIPSLARG